MAVMNSAILLPFLTDASREGDIGPSPPPNWFQISFQLELLALQDFAPDGATDHARLLKI
jgi:hypothetical protein